MTELEENDTLFALIAHHVAEIFHVFCHFQNRALVLAITCERYIHRS